MNIPIPPNAQKENLPSPKNALLIRVKTKLPKPIKAKLKRMGAVWLEVYQGYAIPLEQKTVVEELLSPWKENIQFSEERIDPSHFSSASKARNSQDLRISILQEEVYRESMQLMLDIRVYDPNLSEPDFDEKPPADGKTSVQLQVEAEFYERRQSILGKRKELGLLTANATQMLSGDNPFTLDENGLWYLSNEEGKVWISSPLCITARTRDENGLNHGKLIEFDDADGVHHNWTLPMELLAGDCSEFRSILMNAGLGISIFPKPRQWLADYVQRASPSYTARCVSHTGWYKEIFILPNENIGNVGKEKILVQGKACNFRSYHTSGVLLDWQKNIADLCVGNSRLIFAVSVGFAGPLLNIVDMEGGGFHFRSQSSSGKTTALRVAASLYGDKNFMRKWKATINGLETIAYQHNDALLCLDEMDEISPYELGEAAYMLASGIGKGRARADGGLRETLTWRVLFLSSGEISLASHMEQAGKKSKAGQEIRLAEIPAHTGKYGIFEELHSFPNGSTFADAITRDAYQYYGTPIREFLKKLTQNIPEAKVFVKMAMEKFLSEAVPSTANGQIYRVAMRFALAAAAGELAIHYNITRVIGRDGMASIGWNEGDAVWAAKKCFQDWLEAFGGTNLQEETQLLADVHYFLEQHAESRFTDWYGNDPNDTQPSFRTHNRAGFRKHTEGGTEFYVFPETFKRDICKGREEKFVKECLHKHGLLKRDSEGKFTCSAKPISEAKSRRFYVLVSILGGEG